MNAFLEADTKERRWTIAGLEFGAENVGRKVLIVRALYGLRSSGKCFREALVQTLRDAGFESCKADPDMWMQAACKEDGTEYYEYFLCYVDDVLCCLVNPKPVMETINKCFTLKPETVKEPDCYLGAQVRKMELSPGKVAWGLSSNDYVKRMI